MHLEWFTTHFVGTKAGGFSLDEPIHQYLILVGNDKVTDDRIVLVNTVPSINQLRLERVG